MALSPEGFDFLSNLSTLWAVILGAVLATAGGLAGGQIERVFERREREKDSALLFAEIFSTLKIIIDFANDTRRVGDPYGPITMRMVRAAKRELDLYDRNREQVYTLRDAKLRGRIHKCTVPINMSIEGILDSTREVDTIEAQLRSPTITDAHRDELTRKVAQMRAARDSGFDFVVQTSEELKSLIGELGDISGGHFIDIEAAKRLSGGGPTANIVSDENNPPATLSSPSRSS